MLGHVFFTATHFGFVIIICFFTEKKVAVSCLYIELMIGLGTASLGWTVEPRRRQRMAP